MAQLHLVRGIPGSGKSTFVHKMFPSIFHVENDMFHMHDGAYDWDKDNMPDAIAWCASMVETALEHGMDAVVSNTFTKCKFIEHYKKIAEKHGASFHVYRCIGQFKNVHGLGNALVDSFKKSMEDWPGETIVQPNENKMEYEVFELCTGKVLGQFLELWDADRYIAGLHDDNLESQVHVRKILSEH